jgi:hypothetical protein
MVLIHIFAREYRRAGEKLEYRDETWKKPVVVKLLRIVICVAGIS